MRFLGQSAVDFFTTYGWAIVIIAMVMGFMYYFVALPSAVAPEQCIFNYFVTCKALLVGSNSTSTQFSILLVNAQTFPLIGANVVFKTDTLGTVLGNKPCIPVNAFAGNSILCNATATFVTPPGSTINGRIELNVTACPSGNPNNCQPAQKVTYVGNFSAKVQPVTGSLSWP
ncbi:MAG: hypothetical protein KGH50_03220 [Candidatus Micrarchaeota archaeon]|nr:hypothetical protein [Candidatus Micrarchaeota archaeon]